MKVYEFIRVLLVDYYYYVLLQLPGSNTHNHIFVLLQKVRVSIAINSLGSQL